MAHQVQQMAYVGDVPWHGLGNELNPQQPIEVWAEQSGMSFQILETPVRFMAESAGPLGSIKTFADQKVLYRSDTQDALSVVSNRYQVVQPSEVLEFYRDLTEIAGYELETAGVLKGGKKFWALARTGQSSALKGNDVVHGYLTGFDEPMLHTMYVDKKLQGVLAVQALSRLNRCNWKLGKTDTFVLDFYNSVDDIKAAFDPFYTATTLSEPTDVNVLHDLKDVLDDFGIYDWAEVTTFNEKFFASAEAEELHPIIDTVVARFEADLDDEQRIDFKIKAKQFVKIYAQVAAIIPFNNVGWEMLHWFLKFLIPKLKVKDPDQDKLDELLNSIDLSTYGLERSRLETKIGLDDSETELEPQNPNVRGGHFGDGDKDPLDEIVRAFNERHFAGWEATPEEQRVKFINIAKHVINHADYKAQVEDNPDSQNRQLALERLIQQAISVERRRELDLYKRYASDQDFKRAFDASIFRMLSSKDIGSQLGRGAM